MGLFAGFNIASLLGVPLGTFISTTFNWHDSFWLIDILAIFIFSLLLIYVPRNTPQVKTTEKQPGANPLQFMLNKQVILSVCFIMAICSAQFSYYTYIRPILTSEMGFSLTALNLLLLFLGVTAIIGNSLGAWGADHGGMKAIAPLYLIMAIGLILAGLTMHQLPFLSYLLLAVVCMFNSTYGATVQMLFMDIANKRYPQALDLASSLNPVFSNLGISIGSFTAAQLLPYSGPGNIVYLAAGSALVGFVLATILKRPTHNLTTATKKAFASAKAFFSTLMTFYLKLNAGYHKPHKLVNLPQTNQVLIIWHQCSIQQR